MGVMANILVTAMTMALIVQHVPRATSDDEPGLSHWKDMLSTVHGDDGQSSNRATQGSKCLPKGYYCNTPMSRRTCCAGLVCNGCFPLGKCAVKKEICESKIGGGCNCDVCCDGLYCENRSFQDVCVGDISKKP